MSAAALNASKTVEVWQVPARDHALRFSQYKAMVYGLQRALRDARNEWIFWANDHTFLIVENLECFLRRFDSRQPHSLGMRMWGPCCGLFNSGAAGFALSRKAVASKRRAPGKSKTLSLSLSAREARLSFRTSASLDPGDVFAF